MNRPSHFGTLFGFLGRSIAPRHSGSRRSPAARCRRLCSEPLEARQLLTITVDTLVDEADGSIVDGDVSLRDAIALAPSDETIIFSVNGTINLTLGELTIDKTLLIVGPGAALLTIDASGNDPTPDQHNGDGSRVLNIDDGNGLVNLTPTIIGLTLTGGDTSGDGGAIRSQEDTFLAALSVTDNAARYGGGIYAYAHDDEDATDTNVTILASNVSNNSAQLGGGGIWAVAEHAGAISIRESTVSGNSTPNSGGGIGARGGYHGPAGVVDVSESSVTGNSAGMDGGGIIGADSVTHSRIADNSAGQDGGGVVAGAYGYGPFISHGVAEVSHNAILGNTAGRNGGGVHVRTFDYAATELTGNTISGNSAGNDGGGIWSDVEVANSDEYGFDALVAITDSTISGNTAQNDGGGIWTSTSPDNPYYPYYYGSGAHTVISGLTITQNQADADNTAGGQGGGVYATGPKHMRLNHTIVAENRLGDGSDSDVSSANSLPTSRYNVIGVDIGVAGISNGVDGNQIGTVAAPLDPLLGPLADNGGLTLPGGGATMTHALLPGSPAIDTGDPSIVAPPYVLDQRQYYRPVDGNGDMAAVADIGAFEFGSVALLSGDANLDGEVNGLDYLIWVDHFFRFQNDPFYYFPAGPPHNGDFNDDGAIDGLDYLVWADNFGASLSSALDAAQQRAAVDAAVKPEYLEPEYQSIAVSIAMSRQLAQSADDADTDRLERAVDRALEQAPPQTPLVKKQSRRR